MSWENFRRKRRKSLKHGAVLFIRNTCQHCASLAKGKLINWFESRHKEPISWLVFFSPSKRIKMQRTFNSTRLLPSKSLQTDRSRSSSTSQSMQYKLHSWFSFVNSLWNRVIKRILSLNPSTILWRRRGRGCTVSHIIGLDAGRW
jgi:hypothetical protein